MDLMIKDLSVPLPNDVWAYRVKRLLHELRLTYAHDHQAMGGHSALVWSTPLRMRYHYAAPAVLGSLALRLTVEQGNWDDPCYLRIRGDLILGGAVREILDRTQALRAQPHLGLLFDQAPSAPQPPNLVPWDVIGCLPGQPSVYLGQALWAPDWLYAWQASDLVNDWGTGVLTALLTVLTQIRTNGNPRVAQRLVHWPLWALMTPSDLL